MVYKPQQSALRMSLMGQVSGLSATHLTTTYNSRLQSDAGQRLNAPVRDQAKIGLISK